MDGSIIEHGAEQTKREPSMSGRMSFLRQDENKQEMRITISLG